MITVSRLMERALWIGLLALLIKLGILLFSSSPGPVPWIFFAVGVGLGVLAPVIRDRYRWVIATSLLTLIALALIHILLGLLNSVTMIAIAMGAAAGYALRAFLSPVTPSNGWASARVRRIAVVQRLMLFSVGLAVALMLLFNVPLNTTAIMIVLLTVGTAPFLLALRGK